MTDWFVEELTASGVSWALLTGTLDERTDLGRLIVDQALLDGARFGEPLGAGLASSASGSQTATLPGNGAVRI